MKKCCLSLLLLALAAVPAFASVNVSAPMNGQTTGNNVQFIASANTSCPSGVAAMGIYINDNLVYTANGASLNTQLPLGAGWNYAVIQDWDYCGGVSKTAVNINVTNSAGISVSAPANGATVSSPANFVATATTGCSAGVGAIGIYVNNNLVYTANGASLNTQLPLGAGWNNVVVQDWDNCGGVSKQAMNINVTGSSGNTLWAIQGTGGWNQWGELQPTMDTCNAPCNYQVGFDMQQHEGAVSKSGNGTEFDLWASHRSPLSCIRIRFSVRDHGLIRTQIKPSSP